MRWWDLDDVMAVEAPSFGPDAWTREGFLSELAERGSRTTPQAVAPRTSKLLVRAGLIVLAFVVIVGAGLYFVPQEVPQIPLPQEPDTAMQAASQANAVDQVQEGQAVKEEVKPEEAQPAQLVAVREAPIVRQRLFRVFANLQVPLLQHIQK